VHGARPGSRVCRTAARGAGARARSACGDTLGLERGRCRARGTLDAWRPRRLTYGSRRRNEAVRQASLALDVDAFTLERVVVEERAVFDAAATLAERRRDVGLRAPSAQLDLQQQAALRASYGRTRSRDRDRYRGGGEVTFAARRCRRVREAGFRVIGAAVAGDAARTIVAIVVAKIAGDESARRVPVQR